MRILFLTHAFNSLTQRLYDELTQDGHEVSVEFDINDRVTEEAVALWQPELIVAPFLKRRIPDSGVAAAPLHRRPPRHRRATAGRRRWTGRSWTAPPSGA